MLGTLGSCFVCAEASLDLLLRFSPPADLDSAAFAAGMDWARSLEPLSGLDGFEEENRLWCPLGRFDKVKHPVAVAARVVVEVKDGEAVTTTRRTEEGIMMAVRGLATPQPQ